MITRTLLLTGSLLAAPMALAGWTLDSGSSISFTSTINNDQLQQHHFREFDGLVTDKGAATINIRLASVTTDTAGLDEQLRKHLFEVNRFPTAVLQMSIPKTALEQIRNGQSVPFKASGALAFHGKRVPVKASLIASPAADNSILVTNDSPLMLNTDAFSLTSAINHLRELAGLDSITSDVPVSLNLVFKPE